MSDDHIIIDKISVQTDTPGVFEDRYIGALADDITVTRDSNDKIQYTKDDSAAKALKDLEDRSKSIGTNGGLKISDNKIVADFYSIEDSDQTNIANRIPRANDSRFGKTNKSLSFSNGSSTVNFNGSEALTVNNSTIGAAPSSHTSVGANSTTFGHVKLSDEIKDSGTSDGIAATPKAIKKITDGEVTIGGIKLATTGEGANKKYGYKDDSNIFHSFRQPIGNASTADVLYGQTFANANNDSLEGRMTNNGAISTSLNCGTTYTIPKGYHNGSGKVVANSLASQTKVDTGKSAATSAVMLSGYQAWVNGNKISGNIASKSAATYNTSTSDQTIAAGQYLSGIQTIKGVTTSGIDAANIKSGTVVKVGDANSATRIKNVTGTFTKSDTVSSGQTAAAASNILSGYSAWVNGAEIKGEIESFENLNFDFELDDTQLVAERPINNAYYKNCKITVDATTAYNQGFEAGYSEAESITWTETLVGTEDIVYQMQHDADQLDINVEFPVPFKNLVKVKNITGDNITFVARVKNSSGEIETKTISMSNNFEIILSTLSYHNNITSLLFQRPTFIGKGIGRLQISIKLEATYQTKILRSES